MGERSKRHPNPDAKLKAESAKIFPRDTPIKLRSGKASSKVKTISLKTPEFTRKQQSTRNGKESRAMLKELRGVTRERVWVCVCVCVVVSLFVSNEKIKSCNNKKISPF